MIRRKDIIDTFVSKLLLKGPNHIDAFSTSPIYLALSIAPETVEKREAEPKQAVKHPIRLGTHNITLQWISWDHPGTVELTYGEDGRYKIIGGQKSRENEDYLNIDGYLTFSTVREFTFEGHLEYLVSHNNGGKACIKTGPLHFKASGKRKYWRMQEMTNCEGGMLTDYVDVYF